MKHKLWSRLISMLVISAMALVMLPLSAFATTAEETDAYWQSRVGKTWTNKDGSKTTVTAYDPTTNTASETRTQTDGTKTTADVVVNDSNDITQITQYNVSRGTMTFDTETAYYNSNGELTSVVMCRKDDNGTPCTATAYVDSNGKVTSATVSSKDKNGTPYTVTMTPDPNDSSKTVYTVSGNGETRTVTEEEANQILNGEIQAVTPVSGSSDGDALAVVAVVGAVAVGTAAYFLINPDQWLNVRNTVRGWFGMEQLEPELPTEGDFWLNVSNTLRGWFGMEPLPCKPASVAETDKTAETDETTDETAQNGEEVAQTTEVQEAA